MIKYPAISQYSTSDLAGSAVLVTMGYRLVDIDWSDPQRAHFVFERKKGIDDVMNDFWDDRLEVNPRKFWDSIKMLKARLHSQ